MILLTTSRQSREMCSAQYSRQSAFEEISSGLSKQKGVEVNYPFRVQYHRTRKKIASSIDRMWPSLPFLDQVEILHQEHRPHMILAFRHLCQIKPAFFLANGKQDQTSRPFTKSKNLAPSIPRWELYFQTRKCSGAPAICLTVSAIRSFYRI